jgi:sigma-E factor negative regulatory protein RseB
VNLTLRHVRGPAGRRAVIAAGVIGLLVSGLSVAEAGGGQARHPVGRWPAGPPGKPAAAAGRLSKRALAAGIRMLDQAARAAGRTSYQGVQVISWAQRGGSAGWLGPAVSTVTVDVWHRQDVGTLTRVTAPPGGTWSGLTDAPAGQPWDGLLGLTPALVSVLSAHYAVACTGTGMAGGRPAVVVEALRGDGSIAARFWLDKVTKLPLRRELFDSRAHLISNDGFDQLTLSSPSAQPVAGPVPVRYGPAGSGRGAGFRPWSDQLSPARLAGLRAGGWPVPQLLPGGLTLFDASQAATAAGHVVDLAYSDGLSAVSVFVQRGQLPPALPGWHQTELHGKTLYVKDLGEPDLTWSAGGFVFTVVAAAPAPTLAAAVNALPHQTEPGFWGRMKRGVLRLLDWVNPFS